MPGVSQISDSGQVKGVGEPEFRSLDVEAATLSTSEGMGEGGGSSLTISGSTTFLGLTDCPGSYAGQASKIVRVNAGETGLEFVLPTYESTMCFTDWCAPKAQAASVSAYATKGNWLYPARDIALLAVGYYMEVVDGGEYVARVCRVHGGNISQIIATSEVLEVGGSAFYSFSVISDTWRTQYFRFSSPVALTNNTRYLIAISRSDGADNYALPLQETATAYTDAFGWVAGTGQIGLVQKANPGVGDAVTWDVGQFNQGFQWYYADTYDSYIRYETPPEPEPEPETADYYVAPDGNDANPGTITQPFLTISHALTVVGPGDFVYVRGGAYNEFLQPAISGTAGNEITIAGYPGETATVAGSAGTAKVCYCDTVDYLTFDGLTFAYGHSNPTPGVNFPWVYLINSDHITIENCTFRRDGTAGDIYVAGWRDIGVQVASNSHDATIEDNYFTGIWIGVHHKGGLRSIIRGNTITNTPKSCIDFGYLAGVTRGCLVENNILEAAWQEDGIQHEHDPGAPAQYTCIGIIIRNNIIRNCCENAIDLKGAQDVLIEGNYIYGTLGSNNGLLDGGNRESMGAILRGSGALARYVIIRNNVIYDNPRGIIAYNYFHVYNNTILGNNRDYTGSNSTWSGGTGLFTGFYSYELTGLCFKNNIVVGHSREELVITQAVAGCDFDYNLYYDSTGTRLGYRTGTTITGYTLANWQVLLAGWGGMSGNDANSLDAAPSLTNCPEKPTQNHDKYDFSLRSDSPARNAGGPLTLTTNAATGVTITVADARYFMDGYGATDVTGDEIIVGSNDSVTITSINYGTNQITVNRAITWNIGDAVNLTYSESAPDIGAFEYS